MPNDVTHGRGYVYSLQYHIVWATKYLKPILVGDVRADIQHYLEDTLRALSMKPIAMEVMSDHVHLLVDCKPQISLTDAIKVLKGNSARWLFMARPELKRQLWRGHLWNPSYFVSTVSEKSLSQVKDYIDSQQIK